MGLEIPQPPEYSYSANAILLAYNTIARSRTYPQGVAMPLDASAIKSYLELYEAPCELHIFVECVFALDNLFLDGVRKRMQKKSA
ncbi:hypothetical protein [Acinetobacter sp. YH12073]|uniref:hypothetical protein n=1 Tax=Acinetobacter sp. YH12073 TaxID=2601069 RepID=UPI0015D16718|nr:hypothetical protein [Acinetobacter sp. YH12073]